MSREIEGRASLAESLTRIAIAADLQGIGFRSLLEMVAALGDDIPDRYLGINHRFDGIWLQCPLPSAAAARSSFLELHRSRFPDQHRRLAALSARRGRGMLVELETRSGTEELGCALSSVGPGSISDAVALARDVVDLDHETVARLTERCRELAGRDRIDAITDRIDADGSRCELRVVCKGDDALTRIARTATAVGVAAPQVRFIESSYLTLAGGRPVLVALIVGSQQLRLTVEYPSCSWEGAVKLVGGLHPDHGAGEHLGRFAGALGSEHVESVRISFGDGPMPGIVVWAGA